MAENQSWRLSVAVSAVGVIGTLLGFFLQYYLNIDSERRSAIEQRKIALEQQQSEAYISFLKAFDKDRTAKREIAEALEREYELEGAAAIRRIALYGDERVVAAMAEWYRHDPRFPPCSKEQAPELMVWTRMRESLRLVPTVSETDVAAIAAFCRSGER